MKQTSEARHVVPWLRALDVGTTAALWTVLAVVALFSHVDLPLRRIWPFLIAAALCRTGRLVSARWALSSEGTFAGLSLIAETLLLTGLLDITGGPFNPFIVFYVVFVWLAAAALAPAWGAVVGAVALSGFGWLVLDHVQNLGAEHHRLNDFPTHLFTIWIAGATAAELVGHYVALAARTLAARQREVDDARARAMRSEHLASLMTLAAGAAHELSTPLATIAVAARELERSASRRPDPATFVDDARLIRTEVDRCQIILERMSGRAGTGIPEASVPVAVAELARIAARQLPESQLQRIEVDVAPDLAAVRTDAEAAQALASLLKNAFDASDTSSPVLLRISRRSTMVRLEVHDRGCGMSEEVLRRAGEPFYTTKEPGRGLGLGLFLARAFAERAGGSLWFERGSGTIAILEIPVAVEVAVA